MLDLDLDNPSSLTPSYTPLSLVPALAEEEPVEAEAEAETDLLDSRSAVLTCSDCRVYLKFDCALAACTVSLPLVPVRSLTVSLVAAWEVTVALSIMLAEF